jgi:small-conductance mechanosensitive channel
MWIVLAQTGTNVDELVDVTNVTAWDLLWAALLIIGGIALANLARRPIRKRLTKTNLPPGTVNLLTKLVGWSVIVLGIVFALPLIGIDVTPIFFLVLLVGAVVVVSGKTLIENYGAGVVLQSEANFEPGDQVEAGQHQGKVLEVSSRVVKLETLDGRRVVLSNVSVLADPVVVFTKRPERRSELVVGLAYGTDLDRARQVLGEATAGVPGVLTTPEPEVFVSEFADSSINFLVWFWHASDLQSGYEATDQVARALARACRDNGLTIAFPQRTLWWGEAEESQD